MKKRFTTAIVRCAALGAALVATTAIAAENDGAIKKKRLQIVFMFGQSEMVGQAELSSAAYMLQKPLVPQRAATLNAHKGVPHQINGAYLYWQAMNSYGGPAEKKVELKKLIKERGQFKGQFKQHVLDTLKKNDGMFRGKKYGKRGGFWLYNMCDLETEKEGITPKIRAILEAPDNPFNVEAAYEQLLKDSNQRYQKQLELNKLYLNGTTPDDVAVYAAAVKAYEAGAKDAAPQEKRHAIAGLAEKHLHLPVAERTYITGLGTVAGPADGDSGNTAGGKLSIGYGANARSIGLEYAAGMALEQSIDAPILIIKCAWDSRQGLSDFWQQQARKRTLAHVKKVLADPGKYYPDYDAKAGYDVAGLIWFQGLGEPANPEYGAQLASLLTDFRKAVNTPDLPVVCATVGTMYFKGESEDHPVNLGMRAVAAMPEFKGTVDVVDSYRWHPSELSLINSMIHKRKIKPDAAMQQTLRGATTRAGRRGLPYSGSATFYLLTGNEVGTRLARMIKNAPPKNQINQ
jgi:hypothetical protein